MHLLSIEKYKLCINSYLCAPNLSKPNDNETVPFHINDDIPAALHAWAGDASWCLWSLWW